MALQQLPQCDVCDIRTAAWDKVSRFGPWAFLCEECEPSYAAHPGVTGIGIGQRLILQSEVSA